MAGQVARFKIELSLAWLQRRGRPGFSPVFPQKQSGNALFTNIRNFRAQGSTVSVQRQAFARQTRKPAVLRRVFWLGA